MDRISKNISSFILMLLIVLFFHSSTDAWRTWVILLRYIILCSLSFHFLTNLNPAIHNQLIISLYSPSDIFHEDHMLGGPHKIQEELRLFLQSSSSFLIFLLLSGTASLLSCCCSEDLQLLLVEGSCLMVLHSFAHGHRDY